MKKKTPPSPIEHKCTYLDPTMGPQDRKGWSHKDRANILPTKPVPPRIPTGNKALGGQDESLDADKAELRTREDMMGGRGRNGGIQQGLTVEIVLERGV